MGDEHRKMRVFAAFHSFQALLPNIDRAVDHAVIECQAAHNETTLLRQAFSDHILRFTDTIIISYHQRSLLVDRHHVGVAVHRLVLARRLENETIVPLVRLEIGSKSLLAGRRGIGIRTEAIMRIFNALVSYEDGGTLRLCLRQFRTDFLVELEMKFLFRTDLGSFSSLNAVRRERASVRCKGAMVNGMEIFRGSNHTALLRKHIDQLIHRGNDLLSILQFRQTWRGEYIHAEATSVLHRPLREEVVLTINHEKHVLLGNRLQIERLELDSLL